MLNPLAILTLAVVVPWVAQDPVATPTPRNTKRVAPADAVRRAAEGYVTAVYEAKPELIDQFVRPDLSKLGLVRRDRSPDADHPMTFAELRALCEEGYNSKPARRDIEVLGVMERIACAKLTADWGTDYFHLTRDATDDEWQIRHVIWQTHPGLKNDALSAADRDAIEAAANNYIDAFYLAQPERVDQSVAEDLVKFGYYKQPGNDAIYPMPMNFEQLRDLATNAYKDRPAPKDAPHEVVILDALDHIALVKVVGSWGIDFMNIARRDGTWKIIHVVWQSHPEKSDKLELVDAVNATCPFSGDPIQADSLTRFQGKVVGFCNSRCRDKFTSDPTKYASLIPGLDR